jgi:predicted DNA-binding transcriptional regulator AlpA
MTIRAIHYKRNTAGTDTTLSVQSLDEQTGMLAVTKVESPFLTPDKVRHLLPVSERTRQRAEADGRFPKRRRISRGKVGYLRAEVEDYCRDPVGWVERNAPDSEGAA